MRFASNTSRVVWALLVGGAFLSITLMQITSAAAKPPDGRGGGNGGGNGGGGGGTPPAAVTDLAVTSVTHDSITLEWTASGNSGTEGTAAAYEIRYLINEPIEDPFTDTNWDFAFQTYTEPVPQASGATESYTIHRLSGGQMYDIALRVINGGGTASDLSNQVAATTLIATPVEWDPQLVTQTPFNFYSDFDFDPGDDDLPSIAYGDSVNDELLFTHFNGTAWNTEIIRPGAGRASVGLQHDPSFPFQPTAMIAGTQINGLLFARRTTSGWSFETVDSGNVQFTSTGIHRPVFDTDGNPSVVYFRVNVSGKGKKRTSTRSLHYAVRVGGVWQIEMIDVPQSYISSPSLAYDLGGNAAVSYLAERADGVRELRFAMRTTGPVSWVTETVQAFPTATPAQNSLAFDPTNGLPMIALRARMDFSNQNWTMHVARLVGGVWQIELVDPVANSVNRPILLFDATFSPVIAYRNLNFDTTQMEVLLARFSAGAWGIEVVDASLNQVEWFTDVLSNVQFRFDALNDPWVHFNISHSSSANSNTDELFLTRRVGN